MLRDRPGRTPATALQAAAHMLSGRLAGLAHQVSAAIRTEIPFWSDRADPEVSLWKDVHAGLESTVHILTTGGPVTADSRFARLLGHDSAILGIPLLPLVEAYRLMVALLWEALVDITERRLPRATTDLARAATLYWQLTSHDVTVMTEAHRLAVTDTTTAGRNRRAQTLLRRLVHSRLGSEEIAYAATILGIPTDGRYAVLRARGFQHPLESIREQLGEFSVLHCPSHGSQTTLLADLGDRSTDDLRTAIESAQPSCLAGMSPAVTGVTDLAGARELADLALRGTSAPAGVVAAADRVGATLLLARPDIAAAHRQAVLGPVLELGDADRRQLLETIEVWLDCHCNTANTGKRLFCHPNTILNRLHRVERLTGRSLSRPLDLVALTLAVDASHTTSSPVTSSLEGR